MTLRILTALLLATLSAPAGARGYQEDAVQICAGTVAKSPSGTPGWYEIGGVCFLEPGKASNTILAVCREGDICVVHAVGTLAPDFYIKRVISVYKLCTGADNMTFICPRPLDNLR